MFMSRDCAGRLTQAQPSIPVLGLGRQTSVNKRMEVRELADRSTEFQGWMEATSKDT